MAEDWVEKKTRSSRRIAERNQLRNATVLLSLETFDYESLS